jgi:imidazole glycerol-phosphate synthase subunit HisH
MKQADVAVIDYGVGNLLSVERGLAHCGASVVVTSDPETILGAPRVVLPGVGAFDNGMSELRAAQLVEVVQEVDRRGTPLLGICLGMQMLLDESLEFCVTPGLGLISGRVVPVPDRSPTGESQKIPHIGWVPLRPVGVVADWKGTPLEPVTPGEAAYFVHSFMAEPADPADRLADGLYGETVVSAAIRRGNTFGCQFHPEKSGAVGLKVLAQFLKL